MCAILFGGLRLYVASDDVASGVAKDAGTGEF
jgi:hypothetical protein